MSDKDVKSVGYQREKRYTVDWLKETRAGAFAEEILRKGSPGGNLSRILDDGGWKSWEDIYTEHKDDLVLAANCREAREAFDIARKSHSRLAPPTGSGSKMCRVASFPLSYVLRRQIEVMDPDYWNSPLNFLRECMDHPYWVTADINVVRGMLEALLPQGTKVPITTGVESTSPAQEGT